MTAHDTTIRFYIFDGHYLRRSHFNITDKFISDMNKDLNLKSDNKDGIEITIDNISEVMTKIYGDYPLIMLKDHYGGEFELHDFIDDYMRNNGCYKSIMDDVLCGGDYAEGSEN